MLGKPMKNRSAKLCEHHLCLRAGTCGVLPFLRTGLTPLTISLQELLLTYSINFHLGKKPKLFNRLFLP